MSRMFARFRVDSTSTTSSLHEFNARVARSGCPKGGESIVTFTDLFKYLRAREEGQTMAEYGVVLAVITIGVFIALGALSGAISGAITTVTGYL